MSTCVCGQANVLVRGWYELGNWYIPCMCSETSLSQSVVLINLNCRHLGQISFLLSWDLRCDLRKILLSMCGGKFLFISLSLSDRKVSLIEYSIVLILVSPLRIGYPLLTAILKNYSSQFHLELYTLGWCILSYICVAWWDEVPSFSCTQENIW